MNSKPLVIIFCATYNHASYIKDALDGFVMQKTNFPFVAIVHDDASTDGTDKIVKEYAEKYPDIIKPVYEKENQYSKRDGSLGKAMWKERMKYDSVRYIAHCEGDDYWTDPLKLQKQVDFLESHPDYSMVFSNASIFTDRERSQSDFKVESREYSMLEIYRNWVIPTCTMLHRHDVYRSESYKDLGRIKKPLFSDITLQLCCGSIGKIYGMSDTTGVYRQLSSGATHSIIGKNYYGFMLNRFAIANYFGKEFKEIDRSRFAPRFLLQLSRIRQAFPLNLKFCARLFWFAPRECSFQLLSLPYIMMKHIYRCIPKRNDTKK